MTLENIRPSERSQTPKATCCMIPLIGSVQKRQILTESRLEIARGRSEEREKRELLLISTGFLLER